MTIDTRHASETLAIGDIAPDFKLLSHNEGELHLGWYRGRKNVVLAFYPADWTPVCATQIPGYRDIYSEFDKYDAQLLGISCDSVPCHVAWSRSLGGLTFPLLSDFWPHGDVSRKYGVLTPKGYSERAVFVIDKAGIIRYIEIVDPAEMPEESKLLAELAKLPEGPGHPDPLIRNL